MLVISPNFNIFKVSPIISSAVGRVKRLIYFLWFQIIFVCYWLAFCCDVVLLGGVQKKSLK